MIKQIFISIIFVVLVVALIWVPWRLRRWVNWKLNYESIAKEQIDKSMAQHIEKYHKGEIK